MRSTFWRRYRRSLLIFGALFGLVGLDQATKELAKNLLRGNGLFTYLGDTMRLQYMENRGAFLSLGAALPEEYRFWFFSVGVVGLLIVVCGYLFTRKSHPLTTAALTLIVGGGAGNIIDRLNHGYVIDFMNVGIGELRTGVFNVADMAILAGVSYLFFEMFQKAPAKGK